MTDLYVTPGPGIPDGLVIPETELLERFTRSSGPGGQGVNTTDSRVELVFDPAASSVLDMGGPLGKAVQVKKGGAVTSEPNDLGGFSVMQAESEEALAAQMKEHPHFMTPDSTIEIVEIMAIPGM